MAEKVRRVKSYIVRYSDGLLLAVEIYRANENEGKAEFRVIKSLGSRLERMKKPYFGVAY
jgi:hypothetical protein